MPPDRHPSALAERLITSFDGTGRSMERMIEIAAERLVCAARPR